MIYIIKRLDELKTKYNWTNYQLAKECGLSESTIKNIYNRNSLPHIDTLEAICNGFGLSLSQFLLEDDENLVPLNEEQREMFEDWKMMTEKEKHLIKEFIEFLNKARD